MIKSSLQDGTRLTVFQHLLKSLQQPLAGPFSVAQSMKKKTASVVAVAQKSLMRSQSRSKQPLSLHWTESNSWGTAFSGKAQSKLLSNHHNIISSYCYDLDSEFYDEQCCIPIIILFAIRTFLLRLIQTKLQYISSSEQLISANEAGPSPSPTRSSSKLFDTSSSPPTSPLSHISPGSRQYSPSHENTSLPPFKAQSSLNTLSSLEYESLHNLFREGCAASSPSTRLLSSECVGIIGAFACLSADEQQLGIVVQVISRWTEAYSTMV